MFHDPFVLWSPIVSYIYHFPLLPLTCACNTFISLLSHIFYIFPNESLFQINHVIFHTPFGLNYFIHLTYDLHSLQLFHTFCIYCFLGSYQSFMLLVLVACSCVAIIKAAVVLFKHPFLSHPHRSSLALPIVCLINCLCNSFCVYFLFPLFVLIWCFSIFMFFFCACGN